MPTIINIGSMAATGFGFTKTSLGGANYFLGVFTYPSTETQNGSAYITSDSSGNLYVVLQLENISVGKVYLVVLKLTSSGTIVWQQKFYSNPDQLAANSITVSSSGNIAISGNYIQTSSGTNYSFVLVLNNSGSLQFARYLTPSSGSNNGYDAQFDSSGNIYLLGSYQNSGGYNRIGITKFSSSGTKTWDYYWSDTFSSTNGFNAQSFILDSSNNINVATGYNVNAYSQGGILQVNSSGTETWENVYGSTSSNSKPLQSFGSGVDSSNNVYATNQGGYNNTGGVLSVIKYNSSGTTQWTSAWLNSQAFAQYPQSSNGNGATDSSGNTFVALFYSLTSNHSTFYSGWVKVNSSGSSVFGRYLGVGANNSFNLNKYSISPTGDIYFSFIATPILDSGGNPNPCIAVLPGDGSLTGTYTLSGATFTYGSLSVTSETFTPPNLGSVTSRGTSSQTNTTPTVSSTTGSTSITTVVV